MSRPELPQLAAWWYHPNVSSARRSVYRVQCYTAAVMREMTGAGFVTRCDMSQPVEQLPAVALFRVRPSYRGPVVRELRDQVAAEVRRRRAA